jgi:hypothetical protein
MQDDSAGHLSQIREKCFEGRKGFDTARGKLLARIDDSDKDGGVGQPLIMRYLGHGKEDDSTPPF